MRIAVLEVAVATVKDAVCDSGLVRSSQLE